jgi:hypothetical protein
MGRKYVSRHRVARGKVAYQVRPELDCGTYWPRTQREFLNLNALAEKSKGKTCPTIALRPEHGGEVKSQDLSARFLRNL